MTDSPVRAFIGALKKELAVDSDEQLAVALGVGKSTIASWRRRGSLPKKWQVEILREYGIGFDRIAGNRLADDVRSDILMNSVFYLALLRLGRYLPEDRINEFAAWLGERDDRVRMLIAKAATADDLVRSDPKVLSRIFMDVAANLHATPEQIIELKDREPAEGDAAWPRWFPT